MALLESRAFSRLLPEGWGYYYGLSQGHVLVPLTREVEDRGNIFDSYIWTTQNWGGADSQKGWGVLGNSKPQMSTVGSN